MDTTDTSTSHRIRCSLRLRAQVERLIDSVEAIPSPETFADAQKFARALMLTDKAVAQIMNDPAVAPSEAATLKAVEEVAAEVVDRLRPDFLKRLDQRSIDWWNAAWPGVKIEGEQRESLCATDLAEPYPT